MGFMGSSFNVFQKEGVIMIRWQKIYINFGGYEPFLINLDISVLYYKIVEKNHIVLSK